MTFLEVRKKEVNQMTIESEIGSDIYDLKSHPKGGILSQREINILRFVNEFGFCEIKQIMKRFELKKSSAYLHMQILKRLGIVLHAQIIPDRAGAYYLTYKGVSLLNLDLPPIRHIPLNIYEHHIAVIDVHLKLRELHQDAIWISERRYIRDRYAEGLKKNEHFPDGILVFSDGLKCAIEVERSRKKKERLESILLGYGLQNTFKEVWYFCSPDIFVTVKELANNMSYVKTFNLTEYLT